MSSRKKTCAIPVLTSAVLLMTKVQPSCAAPLPEPAAARDSAGTTARSDSPSLPAGIRILRDVPYGTDARQRFDVYSPEGARAAPVIFPVHGGGWRMGTKDHRAAYENKVARWVPMGFIVISADYRVLPEADPLEQARDVAMENRHPRLFDEAFGSDLEYWKSTSPYHALMGQTRPILAVRSSRIGYFCRQARQFAAKADASGVRSPVLKKDYSNLQVNERLGADRRYTRQVESFLASLDDEVAKRLHSRPPSPPAKAEAVN